MPESFVQPSAVAIGWLLTYALHSAVLIGGVWCVTRMVDLQPATRAFLWRLALIGGIGTTTAMILAPSQDKPEMRLRSMEARLWLPDGAAVSWGDDLGSLRADVVGWRDDDFAWRDEVSSWRDDTSLWVDSTQGSTLHVQARLIDPSPECRQALRSGPALGGSGAWKTRLDNACGSRAGVEWFHTVLALWLCGGLFGLGILARHRRALREVVVSLGEPTPRSRSLLDGLGAGASAVRLSGSNVLGVPCVLPGNTIVLPRRCEEELSDGELRAVLAHELAHVIRRDVLWSAVVRAVSAIFWFQPLNRLALTKLVEATELTCDDWALDRTGEPIGLARSLSRVAEWAIPPVGTTVPVFMAGSGGRGLAHRVQRILFPTRARSEPRWLRAVAATLLMVPLYWLPSVRAPSSLHAAFVIEERDVLHSVPANAVERRIIVARVRSG